MIDITRLQNLLSKPIAMCPDKVALRSGSVQLRYKELDREIRRLAAGLTEKGVRVGDRKSVLSERCSGDERCYEKSAFNCGKKNKACCAD